MALYTGLPRVTVLQREPCGDGVVESGLCPTGSVVALGAVLRKSRECVVQFICLVEAALMARNTLIRCVGISGCMTLATVQCDMIPG